MTDELSDDWKKNTLKILEELKGDKPEEKGPKHPICLRCQKELPEGSNICPSCGHPPNDKGRKILLDYCMNTKSNRNI